MERKIKDLLDLNIGTYLKADTWLNSLDEASVHKLRRRLKRDWKNDTANIVCATCQAPVYLAGNRNLEHFFKHFKELGDCPIKTKGRYSQRDIDRMKYNGAKESRPHIEIKNHLAEFLTKTRGCQNIQKEVVVKSTDTEGWWKKPDVSLEYNGRTTAIEIQLSTTFLDVLVERDLFYEKNKYSILWVFNQKSAEEFRFTEKDIYYDNSRNAFSVTQSSISMSQKMNELFLQCHYQVPVVKDEKISDKWERELVPFTALQLNPKTFKLYYHDYESAYKRAKATLLADAVSSFNNYWLIRTDLDFVTEDEQDKIQLQVFKGYLEGAERFDKKLSNLLSALYSIRHGKIIGSNLPNFVSLSNFMLTQRPEFADLYLKALSFSPKLMKDVGSRDSFQNKVAKHRRLCPEQDHSYDNFLELIFPKLF